MVPITQEGDIDPPGRPHGEFSNTLAAPIGGAEVALRRQTLRMDPGHRAFHETFRPGANDWGLFVGDVRGQGEDLDGLVDLVGSTIRTAAARIFRPSIALAELHRVLTGLDAPGRSGHLCAIVMARIELDSCGAWVTLSAAGHPRPVVIRHAGWVDVCGNATGPLGGADKAPVDDRVGLGPGDALVLCSDAVTGSRNVDGELFGDRVLPDVLVDCAGQSPNATAGRILAAATEFGGDRLHDDGMIFVLRVPEAIRHQGPEWVSRSTGIPLDQLHLPGYPLGDQQPELWRQRPGPPREAIIRLAPEPPSVPALRRRLRRLLQSWRMDAIAEGDIDLLVTEVATSVFSRTASPVTVVVRYTGPVVRVEIGDGARGLPRRRRPGFDDLTGHRLALVESLASDWGVSDSAKCTMMWFEVSAEPAAVDS